MSEQRKRVGRPPKRPDEQDGRVSMSLRVSPSVRKQLEDAAQTSGRSLSQEAEMRLEGGLRDEMMFGGAEIAQLVLRLVVAFQTGGYGWASGLGHPNWTVAEWIRNPECYSAALKSVLETLLENHPDPKPDTILPFVDALKGSVATHFVNSGKWSVSQGDQSNG